MTRFSAARPRDSVDGPSNSLSTNSRRQPVPPSAQIVDNDYGAMFYSNTAKICPGESARSDNMARASDQRLRTTLWT
eukprot:COSAG02_NODE_2471_length_8745_cov_3.235485_2_plen_77_part_00